MKNTKCKKRYFVTLTRPPLHCYVDAYNKTEAIETALDMDEWQEPTYYGGEEVEAVLILSGKSDVNGRSE